MKSHLWIVILMLSMPAAPALAAGKHVRELPRHTLTDLGEDQGPHLATVEEIQGRIAVLRALTASIQETRDQAERHELLRQYKAEMTQSMSALRGRHGFLPGGKSEPEAAPAMTILEYQHRMADQIDLLQQLTEQMMELQFALLGL